MVLLGESESESESERESGVSEMSDLREYLDKKNYWRECDVDVKRGEWDDSGAVWVWCRLVTL